MRSHHARLLSLSAAAILAASVAAGCSSSSGTGGSAKPPILIGASLSLTGDFSTDGQAYERGYDLWAHDVNASGGLLGRKVKLVILNDNSSPTQVDTNYTDLITVHHVDLTFGPFSSLLTAPAAEVAHRYGYAFVEGAGGAALVFSEKLPNVFDVILPVANELDPLVDWIKSMPAGHRRLPHGRRPVRHPAGAAGAEPAGATRHQDQVLQGLPGGGPRLCAQRRPGRRDRRADGGARLHRRAHGGVVHEGVRAAALQPEDLHRRRRAGPGRRVHQRGRDR